MTNDAGSCAGKPVKGMAVFYTPHKGYRGNDTFTIGYFFEKYPGSSRNRYMSNKYNVTVK